jgi:MoxR-like ATPase
MDSPATSPSGLHDTFRALREDLSAEIVGQAALIERLLIALLADGHLLVEGAPGLAKTSAVRALAARLEADFARVQFTPDLLPADLTGTEVWRPQDGRFEFQPGPIFHPILLADEINRAPAKVQSALLEAMAEGQVSIGRTTYPLPQPFLVMATQNPIESEGVYQLPEAQRDRFLMKVVVDYPDEAEELTILQRMSVDPPRSRQVLTAAQVLDLQAAADRVFVHHAVAQYAVRLVVSTRDPQRHGLQAIAHHVEFGVSPRATLGLVAAARGLALMRGRDYALPRDVADVAPDVLAHRLVLTFDAIADGADPRRIVEHVLSVVPAPQVAPHDAAPHAPGAA